MKFSRTTGRCGVSTNGAASESGEGVEATIS